MSTVESGTWPAHPLTGVFKEIRGKVVQPGIYTMPMDAAQNGDHLGISISVTTGLSPQVSIRSESASVSTEWWRSRKR